jgi:transcriptional regulator GlxA family with amidase domain
MGWLIKRGVERKKTLSVAPKNIVCPVCKGYRTIRVQPQELLPWDRAMAAGEHRVASVETTCWACHGEGRVPANQGDYVNNRFDR